MSSLEVNDSLGKIYDLHDHHLYEIRFGFYRSHVVRRFGLMARLHRLAFQMVRMRWCGFSIVYRCRCPSWAMGSDD